MAIYKKIDGKDRQIANNSIITHNQLEGRDVYGAHKISAIRGLPEKLTLLKNGKVDKDQIATEEIAGIVWAWEDEKDNKPMFHIWLKNPLDVEVHTEENEQGGVSYIISATSNYTTEENSAGGISYQIGEND